MDNFLKTNSKSANPDEFEENDNDSDLEGRLYAEIYFSNEIHETGENYEDNCMQTIEDIKKASRSATLSSELKINETSKNVSNSVISDESNISKNQTPKNNETVLKSARKEKEFSPSVDKNLNLEKHLNLEVESDNILGKVPNEIIEKDFDLQQKKTMTHKDKSEVLDNEINNCSPILTSRQREKNSRKKRKSMLESPQKGSFLTTPTSVKRKSKGDKESEKKSKRRSDFEFDNIQLNPVHLNSRKSRSENNFFPPISDGAMKILFPKGWKDQIEKVTTKSKVRRKEGSALDKINSNDKQKESNAQNTNEVIEIVSSDSSEEDSDVVITETPKKEKRKKAEKQLPRWLDVSSDSSESIFEIPVPRKPTPPCVNVKDSDAESDDSSSDGIYDLNSSHYKKKKKNAIFTPKPERIESEEEEEQGSLDDNIVNNFKKSRVENLKNSNLKKSKSSTIPESSSPISVKNTSQVSSQQSELTSEASNLTHGEESEEDHSIGEDLILNCSLPSLERSTEYNEYVELLNDSNQDNNQEPNTSKINKKRIERENEMLRKSSKEKSYCEYFFSPMPQKIRSYYDDSWGGEDFSFEAMQKKMSKNPKHWSILDEDWKPRRPRYFLDKVKCSLCRQTGHMRANCPEPKKFPVCHMCGTSGHRETRCPHKICLTCGRKQNTYRKTCEYCNKIYCKSCSSRGHREENCPDHWRQYHNTTKESEHKSPRDYKKVMKPAHLLVCCNCTKKGHDSYNCPKYRWSPHHPTPSHVRNYNNHGQIARETLRIREDNRNMAGASTSFQSPNSGRQNYQPEVNNQAPAIKRNPANANTKIVLFEVKLTDFPKAYNSLKSKFYHTVKMTLNDIKGANLQQLIAGRCDLGFLRFLTPLLKCDFSVILYDGWKVELTITYSQLFENMTYVKRLIELWVRIIDREKIELCFKKVPNTKGPLMSCFAKKYKLLSNVKHGIEQRIENLIAKCQELNNMVDKPNYKPLKGLRYIRSTVDYLVPMLYEQGCGLDEKDYFGFQETLNYVQKSDNKHITLDKYIRLFYYFQMMFPAFTPPDLTEMINKFYEKNGSPKRVSFDQIYFTRDVNIYLDSRDDTFYDEIDDRQYDQVSSVNMKLIRPIAHCVESPSTSTIPTPKSNKFVFPSSDVDFIPTSSNWEGNSSYSRDNRPSNSPFGNERDRDYHNERSRDFNERNMDYNERSRDFNERNIPNDDNDYNDLPHSPDQGSSSGNNPYLEFPEEEHLEGSKEGIPVYSETGFPTGKFKKGDNRSDKTHARLNKSASIIMKKALNMNIPEVTQAAIRLGNMLKDGAVYRKHLDFLQKLMKKYRRRENRKAKQIKNICKA